MIEIVTGVPGAGKTLLVVSELWDAQRELVQRRTQVLRDMDKAPPEDVEAYLKTLAPAANLYSNIEGLRLAHFPLTKEMFAKWWELPKGSRVVVDEAQYWIPPMTVGSKPPEYIERLSTHRHHGIDFVFISQHPKLIHATARRMCQRHRHVRRWFGGARTMVYEWDAVDESVRDFRNAVKRFWSHRADVFNAYKSAELHTKQKLTLPRVVYVVPVLMMAAIGLLAANAGGAMAFMRGESFGPPQAVAKTTPAGNTSTMAKLDPSAPAGPAAPAPVPTVAPPRVVGCVVLGARCSCLNSAGDELELTQDQCLKKSRALYFDSNPPEPRSVAMPVMGAPDASPRLPRPDDAPLTWLRN